MCFTFLELCGMHEAPWPMFLVTSSDFVYSYPRRIYMIFVAKEVGGATALAEIRSYIQAL